MHGCGWDSGAARERTAAHWLPASPRVTRSAPMAWALRARAPVAAGSLPRATRSAPKGRGRCAPGRLHVPLAQLELAVGVATLGGFCLLAQL